MSEKTWREAKPKWAVEEAEKEIASIKRRAALRWPDEARPTPVAFQWGSYDKLSGEPAAGQYFYVSVYGSASTVHVRHKTEEEKGWKTWRFSADGHKWHDNVQRGPLYETEREAKLAALWAACDAAAKSLENAWDAFVKDRGYW